MPTFAYLRVSTQDQTTEQQLMQITNSGFAVEPDRVFIEHGVSGKVPALQREQFSRLNDRLATNDRLVICRLDRLGRDTLDVIATIQQLVERGVQVTVLGLGTLDGSPQSNLTMTMLAAISSFERQLISERTKQKLAHLKSQGVKLGRPVKVSDMNLRDRASTLFSQGMSWRKVAAELDIALSTLQRLMKSTENDAINIYVPAPL